MTEIRRHRLKASFIEADLKCVRELVIGTVEYDDTLHKRYLWPCVAQRERHQPLIRVEPRTYPSLRRWISLFL